MSQVETPIDRVIAAIGGQMALARLLGISQAMVSHWVTGRKAITPERAVQIEQATAGAVRRHELRPDIFEAPTRVEVYPE
jgi:DNA-binding transcriptional regulator YdaS (Cro superfamily)